jgi:hypothetical protein
MTRRELDRAIAQSRNGDVSAALETITPKRKRTPADGASRAGQRADQSGKAFQSDVRQSLEEETKAGRCVYVEGNPRVGGAPGSMFPVEATRVDFQVLSVGISIACDCKVFSAKGTVDGGISIASLVGTPKSREKLERQIRYLIDFRKQGGIAFLFLHEVESGRAWLCFALQTLLDGGTVKVRTRERERGGIPARVIDHLPAIEPNPRLIGPRWPILEAAIRHGTKTIPHAAPVL